MSPPHPLFGVAGATSECPSVQLKSGSVSAHHSHWLRPNRNNTDIREKCLYTFFRQEK